MENGAVIQMNRALGKNILHPLSCVVVDKGFYTTWTAYNLIDCVAFQILKHVIACKKVDLNFIQKKIGLLLLILWEIRAYGYGESVDYWQSSSFL